MPVLYDPGSQTSFASLAPSLPASYTLNVVTTQWISKGVLFRFQVYDGFGGTYGYQAGASGVTQFDLVVQTPIPPATVLVVAQTTHSTAMWDFTGTVQYTNTGAGLPAAVFKPGNSTLCWAWVPTATGGWAPARGQPMFAIGFNLYSGLGGSCEAYPYLGGAGAATAPNFPDQFSGEVDSWVFDYTVVFPLSVPNADNSGCDTVTAIKYRDDAPTYSLGSWSQLRGQITQPWTVLQPNYYSTSNWLPWRLNGDAAVSGADVGPFVFAAAPGQLTVVYFRPLPKDIDTATTPLPGFDPAEVAFLLTAPLPPQAVVYFTIDEWDALNGGFGPHGAGIGAASFVDALPSFQWVNGNSSLPAGTVVLFTGIGGSSGVITVQDARNSAADVGGVTGNTTSGKAVVSLIVCGSWLDGGIGAARPAQAARFVTAALSEQYAGDWPDSLSPGLSVNLALFVGPSIYLQGQTVDNRGLPGSVQAAIINSSPFLLLPNNTSPAPTTLPVFVGMAGWQI